MSKIKVGVDGADVTEFVLRSPHYCEVKVRREPTYRKLPDVEYTWYVSPVGEDFKKPTYGNGSAQFDTLDEAQKFAHELLGLLDGVAEAKTRHREAITGVWTLIRDREVARRLPAGRR